MAIEVNRRYQPSLLDSSLTIRGSAFDVQLRRLLFDWTPGTRRSTFRVPMPETSAAVVASAKSLSVKYGTQVVLDGATIAFTEGEHIGLVGRNGSGKSTFLQPAAGGAKAASGEFACRRDLVTAYMPQVSGLNDAATVRANILSGAQRILDL